MLVDDGLVPWHRVVDASGLKKSRGLDHVTGHRAIPARVCVRGDQTHGEHDELAACRAPE